MQAPAEAEAFCRAMMVELEDQWTRARGHQERHPLREKMRQLGWLTERVAAGEDLDALFERGRVGDDALRCLVCEELQPRWEAMKAGAGR
jgi:hypothetical protein